jgi:hypothetical protein
VSTAVPTAPGVPPLRERPPGWARALGAAGLIPFVAGALAVALADEAARAPAAQALAAYAAVIVSFLGGIHWGLAFARLAPPPAMFAWGVLPSLVGWAALLLPPAAGLALLAAMIAVCYAVDHRVYPRLQVGHWLPLRRALSAVAALSCAVGAWLA